MDRRMHTSPTLLAGLCDLSKFPMSSACRLLHCHRSRVADGEVLTRLVYSGHLQINPSANMFVHGAVITITGQRETTCLPSGCSAFKSKGGNH